MNLVYTAKKCAHFYFSMARMSSPLPTDAGEVTGSSIYWTCDVGEASHLVPVSQFPHMCTKDINIRLVPWGVIRLTVTAIKRTT